MGTIKGSSFDFHDQGAFYSILDLGGKVSNTAVQNDAAIAAAITTINSAGGGVLLVPHGVLHNFNPLTAFPVTANSILVWFLQGNKFALYSNKTLTQSFNGQDKGSSSIQSPVSGASIQIADNIENLILDLAATIAALTVTLPQNPQDRHKVNIYTNAIVTALTLNAGTGEVIAAGHGVTTLAAKSSVEYIYNSANSSWYRTK